MPDPSTRALTLVVLAGGLGSRFGGAKQLASVGPGGEVIMDYSVLAAAAAGFDRVVLIVRTDIVELVADHVARWPASLHVTLVAQDDADPPAPQGRSKPPGTAHAVLCARPQVPGPFAVINADDLYAAVSYRLLRDHLCGTDTRHAVVGFPVEATLLGTKPVSRALLRVDGDHLVDIAEGRVVHSDGGLRWERSGGGETCALMGGEPVSMNCFGFRPTVFDALERAWDDFVAGGDAAGDAELLLPDVVRALVPTDGVAVLDGRGGCVGVTHTDDLPLLRAEIARLVDGGELPRRLWPD